MRGRSYSRIVWLCGLALVAGCGYPAVEPENMELITSLRTACSARNDAWLKANEEKVEKRHADGAMSDDAYETFSAIIAQARGGDWAAAEAACLKFQKAQRPSVEQVEKARAFHEK
jgi:hypothetical protein